VAILAVVVQRKFIGCLALDNKITMEFSGAMAGTMLKTWLNT
jgi:hypothetical protein